MKKLLLIINLSLCLAACGETSNNASASQTGAQIASMAVGDKEASTKDGSYTAAIKMGHAEVPYQINQKGIVIFKTARDMFKEFNDFSEPDQIQFKQPFDFKVMQRFPKNTDQASLDIWQRRNFLNAIYQVFAHTETNQVSVESDVMDDKTGEMLSKPLKATVTREKALAVLQKYSDAQSFDDLVESQPNEQYRILGYSASSKHDKFVSDLQTQEAIVDALTS